MDNDQLKIALTNLSRETPLTSVREAIAKIAAADDEGKIARTRMLRVVDGMIKGRRPATTESTKNPESGSVTERVKVALSNSGMDKYLDAAAIVELRPPQEAELLQQVKLDLMAGSLDAEKFTRENGLIAVANKYLKLPVFSEVATSLVNAVQRSEGEPPDRYIQEILTAIDESITNPDKRQNWNATARRYLNESTTIIEREGSNKAAVDNFAEAIRQQKGQYPIVETMIKFLAELARLEKRPPERQQ